MSSFSFFVPFLLWIAVDANHCETDEIDLMQRMQTVTRPDINPIAHRPQYRPETPIGRPWFLTETLNEPVGVALPNEDHKFGFCGIAKVGSATFRNMFGPLGFDCYNQSSAFPAYARSSNGWKFGAFFRDPAQRFLSVWLAGCDKEAVAYAKSKSGVWPPCLHANGSDPLLITDNYSPEKVLHFERAVREALPQYMSLLSEKGKVDKFYDPQIYTCDSIALRWGLNYVGRLSMAASDVNVQVANLMHLAGWNCSIAKQSADEYFPTDYDATDAGTTATGSIELLDLYYRDPEIKELVEQAYESDYNFLHRDSSQIQLSLDPLC